MDRLVERLASVFPEVFRRVHRFCEGPWAEHDISMGQFHCLQYLYHSGPIPMTELCNRLGRAQSTCSEMVTRLTRRGLVERTQDPSDMRVVRVGVAPEGVRMLEEGENRVRENLARLFESMSEDMRVEFVEASERMFAVIRAIEEK